MTGTLNPVIVAVTVFAPASVVIVGVMSDVAAPCPRWTTTDLSDASPTVMPVTAPSALLFSRLLSLLR